jgi:hypothetical protein
MIQLENIETTFPKNNYLLVNGDLTFLPKMVTQKPTYIEDQRVSTGKAKDYIFSIFQIAPWSIMLYHIP